MKALIFHGEGRASVEDRPEPRIENPGDVVIKVSLSGVCGSELQAFTGRMDHEPGTVGHEFVGTISALGDGVKGFSVGQRVVSPASVFCGGCFYCKKGLLSACENFQAFGRQLPGGHAEYVRVPNADAVLEALPDSIPDEKAIFMADLLPGVFAGLEMAGLQAGDSVAIVGCGPTGLAAVLLAHAAGAGKVFAFNHNDYRMAAAEKLGATRLSYRGDDIAEAVEFATGNRGADVAIEAAGQAEALSRAAGMVRRWGTLLSLGNGITEDATMTIGPVTERQVRLVSAGSPAVRNYMTKVGRMLSRGVIDPTPLVSHTLPLSEAPHAFDIAAKRQDGALKILLRP